MKEYECKLCGFRVRSPADEEDIVGHIRLHVKKHHPEWKNAEEDFRKQIRTVASPP
jgi:predicted small metal-binding protein